MVLQNRCFEVQGSLDKPHLSFALGLKVDWVKILDNPITASPIDKEYTALLSDLSYISQDLNLSWVIVVSKTRENTDDRVKHFSL